MLTFYGGGLPHFVDHLAPIWFAFPREHRGLFHARGRGAARARELGIEPVHLPPRRAELVLVASFEDHRAVHPSPTVFLNHGVGQTYRGDPNVANHSSYSGGKDRERAVLHLCPSLRDSLNCSGPTAIVGVPKMDPYYPVTNVTVPTNPTVAVSFHADIALCPETRWAFPYFKEAVLQLKEDFNLIGHCHPRMRGIMERWYARHSIPYFPHFSDILNNADLYVIDNSSTMYEFASTGRGVVTLNAPWYRRDVHHGLRFWDAIPGIDIDNPELLSAAVEMTLEDRPNVRKKRVDAVATAYDGVDLDGHATERAVSALMEVLHG